MIPDGDLIGHYAGFDKLSNGKPTHVAFELRALDDGSLETCLSANWLEYYSTDRLSQIRRDINAYMTMRKTGVIAIIEVSEIRRAGDLLKIELDVKQESLPKSRSHCGVSGYIDHNDLVPRVLARLVSRLESTVDA